MRSSAFRFERERSMERRPDEFPRASYHQNGNIMALEGSQRFTCSLAIAAGDVDSWAWRFGSNSASSTFIKKKRTQRCENHNARVMARSERSRSRRARLGPLLLLLLLVCRVAIECASATAAVSARGRILASGTAGEKKKQAPAPVPVPATAVTADTKEDKTEEKQNNGKGNENANANASKDVRSASTPAPTPTRVTLTSTSAPTPATFTPVSTPVPTPAPATPTPSPTAAVDSTEPQIQTRAPIDTPTPSVESPSPSTQPSPVPTASPEPASGGGGSVGSGNPVATSTAGNTVGNENPSVDVKDSKKNEKNVDNNESEKGNGKGKANANANANKDASTSPIPIPTPGPTLTGASTTPTPAPISTDMPATPTPAPASTDMPATPALSSTNAPVTPTSAPTSTDVPATPTSAPTLTDVLATPALVPISTASPLETNAVVDTPAPPAQLPSAQPSSVPAPAPTAVREPTNGGSRSLNDGSSTISGVADGAGDGSAVQTPITATTPPSGTVVVNDEGSTNSKVNKNNKKNGKENVDKKESKKEDNKENIDDNNGDSNDDSKGDSNGTSTDLKSENEKDNETGDANVNGSKNTSNDVPKTPTPSSAPASAPGLPESPLETSAPVEASAPPTQLLPMPALVPVNVVIDGVNSESPNVPGVAGGDNAVKTPAVATTPPTGNTVVDKEASANAKVNKKKEDKKESKKDGNNENSNSDKKEDDSNDDESSDENGNANASNEVSTRAAPVPTPTPAPAEQQLETSAPLETSAAPTQSPSAQPSPVSVPVPTALPEPASGASGVGGGGSGVDDESEKDEAPTSATTPIAGNTHPDALDHANGNTKGNEKDHGKSNEKDHGKSNGKDNKRANGNGANNIVPTTPAATEPQHPTSAPVDVPVPPVESPPTQSSIGFGQSAVSANANEHASGNEKEHGQGHGQGNGDAKNHVPTTLTTTQPQIEPSAPINAPPVDTPPAQPSSVVAEPTQPANEHPNANEHAKDNEDDHSKDSEKNHSKDNGNANNDAPTTPTMAEPHLEPSTPVNEPAVDAPPAQSSPVVTQPTQPIVSANASEHATGNEHSTDKKNENGNGSNDVSASPATTEPQIDTAAHVDASVVAVVVPPVQPSLTVGEPVIPGNANEHANDYAAGSDKKHKNDNGNGKNNVPVTTATTEPSLVNVEAHTDMSLVAVDAPPVQPSSVIVQPAQPAASTVVTSATAVLKDASSPLVDSHNSNEHGNDHGGTKSGQSATPPEQLIMSAAPLGGVGEAHGEEGESLPSIASPAAGTTNPVLTEHSSDTAVELSSSMQEPSEDQGKLIQDTVAPSSEQPDTKGNDDKSAALPQAISMPVVASIESFPTNKPTAVKEESNLGTPTSSSESIAKSSPQLGGVQAVLPDPRASSAPPVLKAQSGDSISASRLKTESGQPGNAASTTAAVPVERNEGRAAEHAEVRNEARSDEHNSSIAVSSLVFDANSKSPITVDKQLQLSESGDQLISKDPSKPVSLNLTPTSSITEEPEKYVRGQNIESQLTTRSKGDDGTTSDTDLPHVLGGKQRGASKQSSTSASGVHVYESVRYSTSLAAGMSLALLVCFHFVFMDPRLSWTSALWSPNSWEFVLYVQYLQQATSLSALTLLKTPYFLWEFIDTFSWTNFLVQSDESGESGSSGARRRLRTIVLDGLVGYSDRIGQDETKIMYHCVVSFVVAMAIVWMAFLAATAIGKWKRTAENRSIARRILGLTVLVWYFSLFPLSLTASFEMQMEVQANLIETWPMSLSVLALFGVCSAGVAYCARVVLHNSKKELHRFECVAVWGVLYEHYTYPTRMFFMFGASVQIVVGICIGVFGSSSTLLLLLVAIQLMYLVAVYTIEPFVNRVALIATYAVGAVKTVNLALAFAFLQSSEMSTANREVVANVYLGMNALVLYVWLIRLLIVFCSCVAVWSDRKQSVLSSTQSGMYSKDPPSGGVLQVDPSSIRDAPEEHGYRTSISPAESAQMTAMALAPVTSNQTWSREQWERVV